MTPAESTAVPGSLPRDGAATRPPLQAAAGAALVVSVAVAAMFALSVDRAAVFAAYVCFGAAGLLGARSGGTMAARIFLVVYGVAVVSAALLYVFYQGRYGVPYWLGGSDEIHFEAMGKAFADEFGVLDYGGIRRELVPAWHNSVGYIYLVGLLTKFGQLLGGEHTMVPRLFNASCLGVVAAGVHTLGLRLRLEPMTARVTALVVGCLPLMVWTSVQTLRDVVVAMLFVVLVLVWTPDVRQPEQRRPLLLAVLVTLLIVVAMVELRRAHAAVAALVAVVGFLAAGRSRFRLVWLLWLVVLGIGLGWLATRLSPILSADTAFFLWQAETYTSYRVEEVGGGLSAVVFQAPPPLGYVLRVLYAFASPIPIPGPNLDETWRDSGTIVHLMFLPFLLAGLGLAAKRTEWLVVLAAFAVLFVGMAMFTFQVRHIVQYLPFAALIAALGYERHSRWRDDVFATVLGTLGAMAVLYFVLKG